MTDHIIDYTHTQIKKTLTEGASYASLKECMLCKTALSTLDNVVRTETVVNALESFAVLICHQVESTNNTVCPGAVKEMGDIIVPVLTNFLLSPEYVCNKVLGACNDVSFEALD